MQTYTVPTTECHRQNVSVQLTVINCGKCGGTYAINERHRQQCMEHSRSWNCPYCKTGWGYEHDGSPLEEAKRKAEDARRREERARAEALRMRDERDTAENRRRAEKAAKTRLKNRVSKGVCPCCNRHFANLERHLKTKHPGYTA